MPEKQYLYVRGNRTDGRVALSEIDDAHPGGSVFIAHRMVRKVGRTAEVMDRLRDERLVETDAADEIAAADKFAEQLEGEVASERRAAGLSSEKYSDMNPKQLADEAKSRGLKFEGRTTKEKVIDALEADDAKQAAANTPTAPLVPQSSVIGSGTASDSNSGQRAAKDGE